jgi:tetratricopeptide (TPR) repeat protein
VLSIKKRLHIRNSAEESIRKKDFHEAISAFKEGLQLDPHYYWYYLFIGDIYYFELNDPINALSWYEKCIELGENSLSNDTLSPLRYLLKRLSKIYFDKEDYNKAIKYYEWFISFKPSNFHDTDFVNYAKALLELENKEKAISVLKMGEKYSKSTKIRKMLSELTGEKYDLADFQKIKNGYERIPIKTPIIKMGDDICEIADKFTKDIRREGDIITLASAVTALAEGRAKSVDVIYASPLARLLSTFVKKDNYPFGGNAPLCNPLAMQMAINEAGLMRIIFSALFGGVLGKIFRKSGLFYRLAGPQSALIDDMPGAIPPYDYYIILGPKDSFKTTLEVKKRTSCDAAIVDANDLGIAWVVGTSDKSKTREIEEALSDNPQGNGDQQTPIVLLRKVNVIN